MAAPAAMQRETVGLAVVAILVPPADRPRLRLPPVMNDGSRSTSPASCPAGCCCRGAGCCGGLRERLRLARQIGLRLARAVGVGPSPPPACTRLLVAGVCAASSSSPSSKVSSRMSLRMSASGRLCELRVLLAELFLRSGDQADCSARRADSSSRRPPGRRTTARRGQAGCISRRCETAFPRIFTSGPLDSKTRVIGFWLLRGVMMMLVVVVDDRASACSDRFS